MSTNTCQIWRNFNLDENAPKRGEFVLKLRDRHPCIFRLYDEHNRGLLKSGNFRFITKVYQIKLRCLPVLKRIYKLPSGFQSDSSWRSAAYVSPYATARHPDQYCEPCVTEVRLAGRLKWNDNYNNETGSENRQYTPNKHSALVIW